MLEWVLKTAVYSPWTITLEWVTELHTPGCKLHRTANSPPDFWENLLLVCTHREQGPLCLIPLGTQAVRRSWMASGGHKQDSSRTLTLVCSSLQHNSGCSPPHLELSTKCSHLFLEMPLQWEASCVNTDSRRALSLLLISSIWSKVHQGIFFKKNW